MTSGLVLVENLNQNTTETDIKAAFVMDAHHVLNVTIFEAKHTAHVTFSSMEAAKTAAEKFNKALLFGKVINVRYIGEDQVQSNQPPPSSSSIKYRDVRYDNQNQSHQQHERQPQERRNPRPHHQNPPPPQFNENQNTNSNTNTTNNTNQSNQNNPQFPLLYPDRRLFQNKHGDEKEAENESHAEKGSSHNGKREEKRREKDQAKEKERERQPEGEFRKIEIRNFPLNVNNDEVLVYFGKYGEVDSFRFNRGILNVTYVTHEGAVTALKELHQKIYQGRPLIVERTSKRQASSLGERRINAASLPPHTTRDDLKKHFESAGTVEAVDFSLDGSASILFHKAEDAEKAFQEKAPFKGQEIKLRMRGKGNPRNKRKENGVAENKASDSEEDHPASPAQTQNETKTQTQTQNQKQQHPQPQTQNQQTQQNHTQPSHQNQNQNQSQANQKPSQHQQPQQQPTQQQVQNQQQQQQQQPHIHQNQLPHNAFPPQPHQLIGQPHPMAPQIMFMQQQQLQQIQQQQLANEGLSDRELALKTQAENRELRAQLGYLALQLEQINSRMTVTESRVVGLETFINQFIRGQGFAPQFVPQQNINNPHQH